jgi:flagella basal body P-ring formation protein FlgA
VFVRVAVRTEVPALTALRLLPRGAALVAADFEQRPRVVNGLGEHYALDLAALIGARLRRPLNAGEALDSDNLDRPPLIRRGQQVTLIARNPALEIRVAAVAMSDGQAEQRISVQNLNTRQIVEAVVRSGDLVEVPL